MAEEISQGVFAPGVLRVKGPAAWHVISMFFIINITLSIEGTPLFYNGLA
jgi:hypothetical protein